MVVIVFPEGTLDDVQKHQDLKPYSAELPAFGTPCDQQKEYPTYLHMLSCIARQYQVSIVFNMIQARDYDYFTSDVVLNHRGYIEYRFVVEEVKSKRELIFSVFEKKIELVSKFFAKHQYH